MVNTTCKGFTLIELFIVIIFIAIIASIVLPAYQDFLNRNSMAEESVVDTGSFEVMIDGELQRCDSNGGNCKPVD